MKDEFEHIFYGTTIHAEIAPMVNVPVRQALLRTGFPATTLSIVETVVDIDQVPRPDTTIEKLAKLQPIYGTRAITAGNSPGLNSGASAVLIMTEKKAKEFVQLKKNKKISGKSPAAT